MTIVVANYAQAIWPGINSWFNLAYNDHPRQWTELFDQYTSDKNFERDVGTYGTGLLQAKPELAPINYDTMGQSWKVDYRHTTYGLGVVVSREAIEDNLYEQLAKQRTEQLARSARLTQEYVAAVWLSRLFSGSYLQADGVSVCSTAHPLAKGGTASNRPTNGVDLSEASLEQACIDIGNMTDNAGNKIAIMPTKLVVPISLQFEAKRILGNPAQPDTAERNINALYALNMLPQGYRVNNFIEDQDMWVIKTDCPDGMKHFERRAIELTNDTSDFDTENMRWKVTYRDSFGISDWRGIYASPGA